MRKSPILIGIVMLASLLSLAPTAQAHWDPECAQVAPGPAVGVNVASCTHNAVEIAKRACAELDKMDHIECKWIGLPILPGGN